MRLIPLWLAYKYLTTRRKEKFISVITFFSVGGVALSVMVLIVVISIMSGFEKDLKQKIIGVNAHITVEKDGVIDSCGEIAGEIEKNPSVLGSAPFVQGQILIGIDSSITGALIRGVDFEKEKEVSNLSSFIKDGDVEWGHDSILVGKEFSSKFQIFKGDTLEIILPVENFRSAFNMMSNRMELKVSGVFETGMYEYDANMVYVPLEISQEVYGLGEGVHGINIRIKDIVEANKIKWELNGFLKEYGLTARSWMDKNKRLFSALKTEKSVMFILLAMAVAVAATNIISTLIMMVMEKTRDIGILKSLGLHKADILKIFLYEGLIIGVTGTSIGVGLGCLFLRYLDFAQKIVEKITGFEVFPQEIYYFEKIPRFIDVHDVLVICVSAILISVLAAVYPSYKAAGLNAVEALKYE
ncbi:MAG: lipoprotein-releasing ABC transporter permease subunit [bacterium]|nr:lipoprotein-releasing ABC transporter permease subunit [bacterium]